MENQQLRERMGAAGDSLSLGGGDADNNVMVIRAAAPVHRLEGGVEEVVQQMSLDLPESNSPDQPNELIRYCMRLTYNTLMYPYEFARVLIQLGYEPLPAQSHQLWMFQPRLFFPSVHKYVQFIKRADGFTGLYRGLVPKLMGSTVSFLLEDSVINLLGMKPYQRGPKDSPYQWREFAWNLLRDGIRLATASVLTYPFHVIMVRQMAQFVGREVVYDNVHSSLLEIVKHEGLLGLYPGFIPKLLAEMGVLVVTSTLSQICRRVLPLGWVQDQYNGVIVQMAAGMLAYPLEVVSTCMICSGTLLTTGGPPFMPIYGHWADCLIDLYARGGHNRGAVLFWRTVPRMPNTKRQT